MPPETKIGGNGAMGSNSHRVFREFYRDDEYEYQNFETFPALFNALKSGQVKDIILPVENSIIGTVKQACTARDESGIVLTELQTHAIEIHHALIGGQAATLETVRKVFSYRAALDQCKESIRKYGLEEVDHPDTYGAAVDVVKRNSPDEAAIAPIEAAEQLCGKVLVAEMSDIVPNKTTFKIYTLA